MGLAVCHSGGGGEVAPGGPSDPLVLPGGREGVFGEGGRGLMGEGGRDVTLGRKGRKGDGKWF